MQARCYLCKYLNATNNKCTKENVALWDLFSSCSSFQSNATHRYLTNKHMKEIETSEIASFDLFRPGKILYWYKEKKEPSWHLFSSIKELREEIDITIDKVKELATYGEEYCGYIFKRTIRVKSIKKITKEGEETLFPTIEEFAQFIDRSTHTAYNMVKKNTFDKDDNLYCFVMLDNDIAYQKR